VGAASSHGQVDEAVPGVERCEASPERLAAAQAGQGAVLDVAPDGGGDENVGERGYDDEGAVLAGGGGHGLTVADRGRQVTCSSTAAHLTRVPADCACGRACSAPTALLQVDRVRPG